MNTNSSFHESNVLCKKYMAHAKRQPVLDRVHAAEMHVKGEWGRLVTGVLEQWVMPAPFSNPEILEMFRDPDRKPLRDREPWAGEFAGKYLTHAVQLYRVKRTRKLQTHIQWFVDELIALQADDGYLGPWPKEFRLRPGAPNSRNHTLPWDAWGHYHAMLGLLLWHETSCDPQALACACRIGDLFCNRFLGDKTETLHGTGCQEMNLAPVHSLALLYRATGTQRYLDLALQIVREFEVPPAGDYVREALAGKEFYQTPKPRWESLHPIMGLSELYLITGEEKYKQAFENIWWSIAKTDRHNNGGFSSGEAAQGNPYDEGPIETCCTVAWGAMSVEMLRLTGCSIVADEIELSTFNSGVGMMSPSGRWVTYNTPMDGTKIASPNDATAFQARPGGAELNCCSVNGPRMLGMLSDWAIMQRTDGLTLNFYGPGTFRASLPSGNFVEILQKTEYPRDGRIVLTMQPGKPEQFVLSLRIPHWSRSTAVHVNGEEVKNICAGSYLDLDRVWQAGDRVTLELDFHLHCWVNDRQIPTCRDNWQTPWRVFGPFCSTAAGMEAALRSGDETATMPQTLAIGNEEFHSVATESTGGILDFRSLLTNWQSCETPPFAYAFTEIESDQEDVLPIIFGADWFVCWFVNGVKVYDNHGVGNEGASSVRTHRIDLPLKKGINLIGVRITSGAAGWSLTMGKDDLRAEVAKMSDMNRPWRTSIYRGPILLAYDPRFNCDEDIPVLSAEGLRGKRVTADTWLKPWLLVEVSAGNGRTVRLCDFGSAGTAGHAYRSWLPVTFPKKPAAEFSRNNPLRINYV